MCGGQPLIFTDLGPKRLVLSCVLIDHVSQVPWQGDKGSRTHQTLDLEELEQVHHIVVDVLYLPTTIQDADGVID